MRRTMSSIGLAAVATAASLSLTAPVSVFAAPAVSLPVFNCEPVASNLIRNGDAEEGTAVADRRSVARIPGWTVNGGLTVARYGADPGFPTLVSPGPAHRGRQFFVGGPAGASSEATASQHIDLARMRPLVRSGNAFIRLVACLGGARRLSDAARVNVEFLDAKGRFFGLGQIGTVGRWERKAQTAMLPKVMEGLVPPGTSALNVVITMERGTGATGTEAGYILASVDNVALTITDQRESG